ncbi:unnamed protein product [Rotaria sordida]|uniref:Peptidase A2 domain-containing protein n=1 Tax=Rotaria sordida TaxID=392033 RepID=A0A819KP90_9BILA|nr:unnamed protein product [Rotaria sordida]
MQITPAQLLARKQGETEPVGKFVQDINRLCLKLDNKISEQDKLQYLRRGLRPQLQHYALSITSLQDFLTVIQRHEQIEKETSNQQTSSRSSQQQQNSFNRPMHKHYDYRQNSSSASYGSFDHYSPQNTYHEPTTQHHAKSNKICYQCNKPDGGASVNSIQYPSPLRFIYVPVNNHFMKVLVDTGATNTIIQQSSLSKIRHARIYPVQQQFFLANKSSISIIGYVTLEIKIRHINTYVTAAITKTLCCDVILGEDWIRHYQITINGFTNKIEILGNKAAVPLRTSSSNLRIPIKLRYSINIPSHAEEVVEAFTSIPQASKVLFTPNLRIQCNKNILFSQATIQIQDYSTNLTIINTNDYPLYLASDTRLGFITFPTRDDQIINKNDMEVNSLKENSVGTEFTNPSLPIISNDESHHDDRIFDTSSLTIAITPIHHTIPTGDHPPINSVPYRGSLQQQQALK